MQGLDIAMVAKTVAEWLSAGAILAPIIFLLVEKIKPLIKLETEYIPIFSFAIGVALAAGLAATLAQPILAWIWIGGLAGLGASKAAEYGNNRATDNMDLYLSNWAETLRAREIALDAKTPKGPEDQPKCCG